MSPNGTLSPCQALSVEVQYQEFSGLLRLNRPLSTPMQHNHELRLYVIHNTMTFIQGAPKDWSCHEGMDCGCNDGGRYRLRVSDYG